MDELRDRDLVRLYWPVDLRPAFDALMGIDDAFAGVVASTSQPALGAIRLAWWRDALERLDHAPPPPEPRLQAVATHLLPRGVRGADLAAMEPGWATLLDELPEPRLIEERGAQLFDLGAKLLGGASDGLREAGALYAMVDVERRGIDAGGRTVALGLNGLRFPRRVRPMMCLAALAERDLGHSGALEPEATPGRAFTLLRHRMTGRVG